MQLWHPLNEYFKCNTCVLEFILGDYNLLIVIPIQTMFLFGYNNINVDCKYLVFILNSNYCTKISFILNLPHSFDS